MEHARAVIIGGGVGGTSIAYHLAERGWTDIVLVERAELTSGSTFHSAGMVGQLRGSVTLTKMMMYGTDLYRRLAAETGTDPAWHEVGSLRLASTPERFEELRRQAGWAKTFGLPMDLITADEALGLFPLMDPDGVRGAVYLPTDGWLDPSGLALALAAGARQRGARIRTHTRVVGIGVSDGPRPRVTGVTVEHRGEREEIEADIVVNAGGMFAAEIGRLAGVTVPIVPMAHEYLFTDAIEGAHPGLPQLRDPDNLFYVREEVGGLCMGGYERHPVPWGTDGIPADFNGKLLAPDWPRFEEIMVGAVRRIPAIADAGVSRLINGPEAFTPDNEFILGESDVRGFWVAAGFSAHGIAGAGGIGRQMASWIVDGEPELDLWKMDIRRFGPAYRSPSYTLARCIENYATYYDIHYPNEERQAGRPLRTAPAYGELARLGAVFGEKSGWERPNWFEPNADDVRFGGRVALEALRPRGWAGQHWSPAIAAEALATRQAAGLFDESSFAKLEVSGPGAVAFLQHVAANDIDRPVGTIVYSQLLDRRGGIQADLTITRLAKDRYLIVTGTAFGNHDAAWLRRHQPDDGSVEVRDLTSARVCYGLWGPAARGILASISPDDVSDAGFPYLTSREITVGSVPVLALRVTYVGEQGWELYAPTEYGRALWTTLWEAGRQHGLVAAGYRAIDALRLEKGYRVWSSDITPDETPFEAGLGFAVSFDTKTDFFGRDALLAVKAAGPRRRLRCLVLDDPRAVCLGNEPVRVGGVVVGRVTSGGYGFAVERSIAFAYLPPDQAAIGTQGEIDVFGAWVGFEVVRDPLYDATNERIPIMSRPTHGADWSAGLRLGTDAELRRWLEVALAACDEADELARRHFRREIRVDRKPDRTFVTEADQAIERRIRERLLTAFPDHGLVGEEYGTEAGDASVRWYIDPIDGTHNFMRGVPLFGTLLAAERDGELQVAVMSAPALDERWWAHRGGGAWARNRGETTPRRMRVSEITSLADAQVVYGGGRDIVASGRAPGFERLLDEVWRERGFGDFWGYTLVADGGAEAMVEIGLKSWDAAAPTVLIEEAGGRVTDLEGRRSIHSGSFVTSNGHLHDIVRARLTDG